MEEKQYFGQQQYLEEKKNDEEKMNGNIVIYKIHIKSNH